MKRVTRNELALSEPSAVRPLPRPRGRTGQRRVDRHGLGVERPPSSAGRSIAPPRRTNAERSVTAHLRYGTSPTYRCHCARVSPLPPVRAHTVPTAFDGAMVSAGRAHARFPRTPCRCPGRTPPCRSRQQTGQRSAERLMGGDLPQLQLPRLAARRSVRPSGLIARALDSLGGVVADRVPAAVRWLVSPSGSAGRRSASCPPAPGQLRPTAPPGPSVPPPRAPNRPGRRREHRSRRPGPGRVRWSCRPAGSRSGCRRRGARRRGAPPGECWTGR